MAILVAAAAPRSPATAQAGSPETAFTWGLSSRPHLRWQRAQAEQAAPSPMTRVAASMSSSPATWGFSSKGTASLQGTFWLLACVSCSSSSRNGRRRRRRVQSSLILQCKAEAEQGLRFSVGDRVECNVDGFLPGTVVKQWYHEPGWPEGETVPYQVNLDSGSTIFAPYDVDDVVRKATGILARGKIPVTVLTGFLGAGKTTLLNYILREQHGKKYAVIENEFGDAAIDEMLLDQEVGKQSTMESITVLDNGCLCCTMRDDLVAAIRNIVATVQERAEAGVPDALIDGILIETTGMADPGPVCKTFDMDPVVNRYCSIDGILTVVDAAHFLTQLRRERPKDVVNEPAQQVAFADKVLLNKVDAVSKEQVRETVSAIRSVNAFAPIVECSLSLNPDAVPVQELVEINSFDLTRLLTDEAEQGDVDLAADPDAGHDRDAQACNDPSCTDPSHGHDHGAAHSCEDPNCADPSHDHSHSHSHSHSHADSPHDSDIGSMVLELKGEPLDVQRFNLMLEDLLGEKSADLYRYKGVLACAQQGKTVRYVLQGVHDMLDISFSGEWPAEKPLRTQVVLIGRQLDREVLERRFAECSAGVAAAAAVVDRC